MPGEVGAGSFWTGMTDYVSGLSDLDTALSEIDASWPAGCGRSHPKVQEEPEMVEGRLCRHSWWFLEQALSRANLTARR